MKMASPCRRSTTICGGLLVLLAFVAETAQGGAGASAPALYVLGDSLVDVGNNNRLERCDVSCKANHRPYGVDHPCHSPTGRFSNGYNLADLLGRARARRSIHSREDVVAIDLGIINAMTKN